MPLVFKVFPCLSDNVGILLHDPRAQITIAVDAPDAHALINILDEQQWDLTHILLTHKHADHIEGVSTLKKRFGAHVYGPLEIPAGLVDIRVNPGDQLVLRSKEDSAYVFRVLGAPGHTLGHVAYWYESQKWLFVGDVLFALGCGRLFEGTGAQMWQTLETFKQFPDDTLIFCGHEYTCRNADFVLSLEPNNKSVRQRAQEATQAVQEGCVRVPFPLGIEKQLNPFLRTQDRELQKILFPDEELENPLNPVAVFSELRQRRDHF